MMEWLLAEMSRARGDVGRRMREKILDILNDCEPYRYLGKGFTFRSADGLDDSVNERLIELVDGIMEDVESRTRRAAEEAGVEDEDDAVVAYAKSPIDGRDLVSRLDGHASTLKYFLEGWVAIGFARSMSRQELVNEIFSHMGNPYASNLFFEAFKEGYSALSISSRGYSFGKGNMRNVMEAMSLAEETAINRAFQYGRVRRYAKDGAIGYRTHRGSTFDCAYCDELTKSIHLLTDIVLPAHPRCMCYSTPVNADGSGLPDDVELTFYDTKSGGLVVTQKYRIASGKKNGAEKKKYEKERHMAIVLAQNGCVVEHLSELPGISSCDARINGVLADFKSLSNHNNIKRHFKDAVGKQGANIVVFEFTQESGKIYDELRKLKKYNVDVLYYFSGKDKVYKL